MKTNEALNCLADRDFLDKVYHFAYHRCDSAADADDLCSDILLAVLSSIRRQETIDNFYAYVWTIARRVYADFCERRSGERQNVSLENCETPFAVEENAIEDFIEQDEEREQLHRIYREIAFLSKFYRDVMVLYYLDGMKVKDIAAKLGVSETTVKQRLFSARNMIRKEVTTMNERTYTLKPVSFHWVGMGMPIGNDPSVKAERAFSQNLIYLCKEKPKTAKELSDELGVPMPYVEEELAIQCAGENGTYGTLRKLEDGRYAVNILVVDVEEYDTVSRIPEKHLDEIVARIKTYVAENKERILAFPYLNEQKDVGFVLWSLINNMFWNFVCKVTNELEAKAFPGIVPPERPYTISAVASRDGQNGGWYGYGNDGIRANMICGHHCVEFRNIYGKYNKAHFHCGHSITDDPKLLLTIRALGGLPVDSLSADDAETAAKAIECGYLVKKDGILTPAMVAVSLKDREDFFHLCKAFETADIKPVISEIVDELAAFVKAHIPAHLMNEYSYYVQFFAFGRLQPAVIGALRDEGVLSEQKSPLGPEGMLLFVD